MLDMPNRKVAISTFALSCARTKSLLVTRIY
jgi:hypothetical protein